MKTILAYSGGLDTSVILKWLVNKGYEVICYIADVGQNENFEKAKKKALLLGASKVYVEDLKEEFVKDYVFQAVKSNAIYEGRYLLGTSIARPLIAKKQIEIAIKEGANSVAHGATGKGNDQVRFEICYLSLMPLIEIISPWKDEEFLKQFQGRDDLLKYAKQEGIPITNSNEKPFSMDDNLMHISYEGGILEDPATSPKEDMFKMTVSPTLAPNQISKIKISFKKGIPIKLELENGDCFEKPIEILTELNKIGGANGIGRIDIVENRFVGMKSRGVYETPGGTILYTAHKDIECISLDREAMHLKDELSLKLANMIYNGFWFSPEFNMIKASIEESQKYVEGTVFISLYKGNIIINGRETNSPLYQKEVASMDIHGNYNQKDAKGFIKLQALRLMVKNETLE